MKPYSLFLFAFCLTLVAPALYAAPADTLFEKALENGAQAQKAFQCLCAQYAWVDGAPGSAIRLDSTQLDPLSLVERAGFSR